jgi:hypothetical protein
MNTLINQWAIKWGVRYDALQELQGIFGMIPSQTFGRLEDPTSETYVQSLVRLEAVRYGVKLWRNNVGVLEDATGRPVRYGLANDSPTLNKSVKSGDLIGWRPLIITPAHVGIKIAQFVSRECKRPSWSYSGTEHEKAQLKWIQVITADGGDACFVTEEGSF